MAVQVFVCDPYTGEKIDLVSCSALSYSRLLSAGDSGSAATIPLDGRYSAAEMDGLFRPDNLLVLERDGLVDYMGYIRGGSDDLAGTTATFQLADVWDMLADRGAWDHTVEHVEQWSVTVTASLAGQAAAAIQRGRTGFSTPDMRIPATLPGGYPGGPVTRLYHGYHLEKVGDVLADLMDEGLDIYFKPRWKVDGAADWLYQAGPAWSSGVVHEFFPTVEDSEIVEFTTAMDAAMMTNNAYRVGEGSEVDMLVRSNRNLASTFPLRERVTDVKNVTDLNQLTAMANNDLAMYAAPTRTSQFKVLATHPIDVGDTARLLFSGHRRIPDGWQSFRVVGIAGDLGPVKTVSVQPIGGA